MNILTQRTMNIKSLSMENVKGMNKSYSYSSSKDHSKWVITATSSVPRTCIGDINRGVSQSVYADKLIYSFV